MFSSIGLWYTFKQCFNCLNYEIRWQPIIYQWGTESMKFSLSFDSVGAYAFLHKMDSFCRVRQYYGIYLSVSPVSIFSPPFYGKVRFKSIPGAGFTTPSTVDNTLPKDLAFTEAKNPDLFCLFLGPKRRKLQTLQALSRKVRVNLVITQTILFSLHIFIKSEYEP